MKTFELIAPCHFGMERVLKDEIYDLGYEITDVSDGRVTFPGDADAIVRANVSLRTAERILLKAGSFTARTYDELFEATYALPWEELLPRDAKFWVTKASSVKSALFSPSDIQSIMKKAMVERMKKRYHLEYFPETGAPFPVRVFLYKDVVTVGIDTTGESLHKRGYRKMAVRAPIAENLAAGLIRLTPWHADRILVDPFCGSGTFPIEAAMMAAHILPGLDRHFTAEAWTGIVPPALWKEVREEGREEIALPNPADVDIQGYDIDHGAIEAARANAAAAGVGDLIHFQVRDVAELSHPKKYGFIITNPPYGERLTSFAPGDNAPKSIRAAREESDVDPEVSMEEVTALYRTLGERFRHLDTWSMYLITSYENAERALGLRAAKNRKIYNGMLKTYFYSFPGPKPKRSS